MLTVHNEFKPEVRPGEPIGAPAEQPPPVNPSLTPEQKREDQFEKALADPDTPSPFHQNVYVRTFLGGLLLLGMIAFYIYHNDRNGRLGTYGQTPAPPNSVELKNH
jgi:hypothetical protein